MRDYLYIPLGGNRVGRARLYANLWAVFLISGLWHGAAWTFVLWGAYHGLFLVADRLFLIALLKKLGRIPATLITYVIVLFGWVLFRADDVAHAMGFALRMLDLGQGWKTPRFPADFWAMLAFATAVCIMGALPKVQKWCDDAVVRERVSTAQAVIVAVVSAFLLVLCASMVVAEGFNPFIYFRF
jgi:alginate O-acetyltransferase complex protein AlgI